MARMCVLSGGLVGRFVASTLHNRGHAVRLVDAESILDVSSEIEVVQSQINASNLVDYVSDVDVVINCLPGRIGHSIRENLVSINGMRVADLAFLPKITPVLIGLAKNNHAALIYDVGIAPGLSNAILKAAGLEWGTLDSGKFGSVESSATR